MTAVVIISAVVAVLALWLYFVLSSQDSTPKPKDTIQPSAPRLKVQIGIRNAPHSDVSEGYEPCAFHTRIAGVSYHNDIQDIGGFFGYVRHDPENEYDPNAIAVHRNDGSLVGYIPKDETDELRAWSSEEKLPCMGFIAQGDDVSMWGRVKILNTDSQDLANVITAKYVKWLVARFGPKFLPVEAELGNRPRTKADVPSFLEYMDELIQSLEAKVKD